MSDQSEMQLAELEIRAWLVEGTALGDAQAGLMDGYEHRSPSERLAFVAVLVARVTLPLARKA